jgi:uncharacterized protein
MKVVLDTNVLIAVFLNPGLCAEIYQYCLKHQELILSAYILGEFQRNLLHKLGQTGPDVAEALETLSGEAVQVTPLPLEKPLCKDPSDDPILGTAVAGRADYLVSGDKDLLALKKFGRIQIVSPRVFWAKVVAKEGGDE